MLSIVSPSPCPPPPLAPPPSPPSPTSTLSFYLMPDQATSAAILGLHIFFSCLPSCLSVSRHLVQTMQPNRCLAWQLLNVLTCENMQTTNEREQARLNQEVLVARQDYQAAAESLQAVQREKDDLQSQLNHLHTSSVQLTSQNNALRSTVEQLQGAVTRLETNIREAQVSSCFTLFALLWQICHVCLR